MSDELLYVKCPRCDGERQIYVYLEIGSEYCPPRGEHVDCPLCGGTGEADCDRAAEWEEQEGEKADDQ